MATVWQLESDQIQTRGATDQLPIHIWILNQFTLYYTCISKQIYHCF